MLTSHWSESENEGRRNFCQPGVELSFFWGGGGVSGNVSATFILPFLYENILINKKSFVHLSRTFSDQLLCRLCCVHHTIPFCSGRFQVGAPNRQSTYKSGQRRDTKYSGHEASPPTPSHPSHRRKHAPQISMWEALVDTKATAEEKKNDRRKQKNFRRSSYTRNRSKLRIYSTEQHVRPRDSICVVVDTHKLR